MSIYLNEIQWVGDGVAKALECLFGWKAPIDYTNIDLKIDAQWTESMFG